MKNKEKKYTWFVSYTYMNDSAKGFGNCFYKSNSKKMTCKILNNLTKELETDHGVVIILNFILLAD